ncbi:hypothetical protein JOC77_000555 [Peribacillus deserti]|uniref:DUF3219 domain-containing protein n=1 Tax=Peribacillus deserti TaxID=673318 RepID=A0ABS2QDU2_9BACI|nr:DUF3219 family protein [Peribacillus deserti]MBM7691150.1 hypothetical protein [Peribacillus deserti]
MAQQVILNNTTLNVSNFKEETINQNGQDQHKLSFDFQVTHEEYHDITTLLYEQHFDIRVPENNLDFRGSICNYWTSFTNLYNTGAVGDFHLELIETVKES